MLNQSVDLQAFCDKYALDLRGLTVYTEAASGPYMYTPILAGIAGADCVYAQSRDSEYGNFDSIRQTTIDYARQYSVQDRIQIFDHRNYTALQKSDIVTNSGFVRPMDRDLITHLKPTCVIPLMWETWEFRNSDFDLEYCKQKNILVMGTNEHAPPCDMRDYVAYMGLKMLFDMGFDGGNVVVLGNAPVPGKLLYDVFCRNNIPTTWFSHSGDGSQQYTHLKDYIEHYGTQTDIIILAEFDDDQTILGSDGYLDFTTLSRINPNIKLGVVAGRIRVQELVMSNISYIPSKISEPPFMSYQPYMLGPRPVLDLYAAGLKVGESMARARRDGFSCKDSAIYALKHSPAMDFEGDRSWC